MPGLDSPGSPLWLSGGPGIQLTASNQASIGKEEGRQEEAVSWESSFLIGKVTNGGSSQAGIVTFAKHLTACRTISRCSQNPNLRLGLPATAG